MDFYFSRLPPHTSSKTDQTSDPVIRECLLTRQRPIWNVLDWVPCVQVTSHLKYIGLVTRVQVSLYWLHVGSIPTPTKENLSRYHFGCKNLRSHLKGKFLLRSTPTHAEYLLRFFRHQRFCDSKDVYNDICRRKSKRPCQKLSMPCLPLCRSKRIRQDWGLGICAIRRRGRFVVVCRAARWGRLLGPRPHWRCPRPRPAPRWRPTAPSGGQSTPAREHLPQSRQSEDSFYERFAVLREVDLRCFPQSTADWRSPRALGPSIASTNTSSNKKTSLSLCAWKVFSKK